MRFTLAALVTCQALAMRPEHGDGATVSVLAQQGLNETELKVGEAQWAGQVELFVKSTTTESDDVPSVRLDDEEWHQVHVFAHHRVRVERWDMIEIAYPKDPCKVSIRSGGGMG